MTYYVIETRDGARVALCRCLYHAIDRANAINIETGTVLRLVQRPSGMVLSIHSLDPIKGAVEQADRENERRGGIKRAKRQLPTCSATGEPHRWAQELEGWRCRDCGAIGYLNATWGAWRVRVWRCSCGDAAVLRRWRGNRNEREAVCARCAEVAA